MSYKQKKIAFLLIHGFGGDVWEIMPLADILRDKGFLVSYPTLKGHGGRVKGLRNCTYKDWVESAQLKYTELEKSCDKVYIIGFSMGGLIALQLSLDNEISGIITLNSPIYVWNIKNIVINIIDDIKYKRLTNIKGYINSCTKFPINDLINFKLLLKDTKKKLFQVNTPILIIQSLKDDTVKIKSADYISKNISSLIKDKKYYKSSGHLILWSVDCTSVEKDILKFISGLNEGK